MIQEKPGLDKCYPYDLLELTYLRGRPNSLKITVNYSEWHDFNQQTMLCNTKERMWECVSVNNHTTDIVKRKKLQFWLLTLQNVDRNSWEKISSGINNLTSTGEFIPTETIALSEKSRSKTTVNYHEDFSDESDHSLNRNESSELI